LCISSSGCLLHFFHDCTLAQVYHIFYLSNSLSQETEGGKEN